MTKPAENRGFVTRAGISRIRSGTVVGTVDGNVRGRDGIVAFRILASPSHVVRGRR